MKNIMKPRVLFHWFLTGFIIFYILTGFGISEYQSITMMTFGLLSKSVAFQLHTVLIYPLILLIFLHIILSIKPFRTSVKK